MDRAIRINVGCGQSPINGWRNFDNSLSLKLTKIPLLCELLLKFRLLEVPQYNFIKYAISNRIAYSDASKRIPLSSGSVEVLYSSHMLEHLDQTEAQVFFREAKRVLRPGGIIRLSVPDLSKQVRNYIISGDADSFIAGTQLCWQRPRTFCQRLRILVVGTRHHQWMYDGASLCRQLFNHGFVNPTIMQPGETNIKNPKPLDLYERVSESVYVEAWNPQIQGTSK